MIKNRSLRISIVVSAIALAGSMYLAAGQGNPQLSAIYKTSSVSEGDTTVSLDFALRLSNLSHEELKIQKVVLGDPANAQVGGWARWEKVVVPAHDKVDLQDSVTIPIRAYKAWKSGTPPGIFVLTATPEGDTVASRI